LPTCTVSNQGNFRPQIEPLKHENLVYKFPVSFQSATSVPATMARLDAKKLAETFKGRPDLVDGLREAAGTLYWTIDTCVSFWKHQMYQADLDPPTPQTHQNESSSSTTSQASSLSDCPLLKLKIPLPSSPAPSGDVSTPRKPTVTEANERQRTKKCC
jgi:hypothetical protein